MIITKRFENRHPLLGRHIKHDSRSRDFEFNTAGLQIKSVFHARFVPIFDQGQVGSCTADAGLGELATSPLWQTLVPGAGPYTLDNQGVLKLYSDEETLDGDGPYPPNDFGSSGLTCAKVLKRAGLISAYHWCFSPETALKALSVTPFMFGTSWTDQMFTPDKDGRVHPHGPVMGGHEILCREFREPDQIWFDNSWGESWGVAGRFYLTLKDFAHLLGHEGDVTILIPLQSMRTRTRRHHHKHHRHHK